MVITILYLLSLMVFLVMLMIIMGVYYLAYTEKNTQPVEVKIIRDKPPRIH